MKTLKKVNKIVERLEEQDNKVVYNHVDTIENIYIEVLTDASYYRESPSIGGVLVLMASRKNNRVLPMHWKSKTVQRVCQSSKDAETRAFSSGISHGIMVSRNVEKMLYGDVKQRIDVEVMTDSEPLLRSVGSTKRIENKVLIPTIETLKDHLRHGEVKAMTYVNTKDNLADIFTKWKQFNQEFSDVFRRGVFIKKKNFLEVKIVRRQTGDEIRVFENGSDRDDSSSQENSFDLR